MPPWWPMMNQRERKNVHAPMHKARTKVLDVLDSTCNVRNVQHPPPLNTCF